jgi:hypothetical protein
MEQKPYLTFVGINNEQFVSVINKLHGSDTAEQCQEIMDSYIVESNIVCLMADCILMELELFTDEQIRNICKYIADVYELNGTDWFVFTTM